jgi:hypothetical protein
MVKNKFGLTRRKALIVHLALITCSIITAWQDQLPIRYKASIITTITLIQTALGQKQHGRNPDGTNARAPWRPDERQSRSRRRR